MEPFTGYYTIKDLPCGDFRAKAFTQPYSEMKEELATKIERAKLNLRAAIGAIPKVPTIDEAFGDRIRRWLDMEIRMAENLEAYGVEVGPPSPFTHPQFFGDWEQVRRVLASYGVVDEENLRWMK